MNYKVYIIDDEPLTRKSMITMIDWNMYNCCICGDAESAEEGIDEIRAVKPDIIFTDIKLHEKTGLEMIRELGNDVKDAKIIVMTCYREFDYIAEAMNLGVFAFLIKPLSISDITENLQKAIAEINAERNESTQKKVLKEILAKKNSLFGELSEISQKLGEVSIGENEKIEELKDRIIKLLHSLTIDDNLYRMTYRYIQYGFVEAYIRLVGVNGYSQEFMFSNIDYLSNGEANYAAMEEWLLMQMDIIFENRGHEKTGKDPRILEMKKFAEENYKRPITLEDAAKHVLMSYHYASKLFKKEVGKSFVDYVNYIRIEKAKEFCKDIRYRDYEIAFMVGIENVYYFSRLFKKYTGMSVREYRDKVNNSQN